ncbi:MAG: acyl-CoA dehydrogenase [bacterium]
MTDVATIRAFLEPRHLESAQEVARFVAKEVATRAHAPDDAAARREAKELVRVLARGPLYAAIEAQDLRRLCLIREELGAASPLADAVFALQALGTVPLLLAGGPVAARFAKNALAGEAMAGFAMTEPQAGSDVASMTTSARRAGSAWILDGTKTLISNAGIADFYVVFASTSPGRGAKGVSAFVVPSDAPGLRFVRAQVLSEPHPLGELAFEGCRIGEDHLLGEEGEGMKLGLATLDRLRATVAAAACGMGARALEEALAHAATRRQFGAPLAEHQLVKAKLARMAIDLAASRLLTYRAAWEKDAGAERVTLEAAMAKAFATEAAQRIVDDAVQILGGRGVLAESVVDRLYRAVRSLRIYEGTTEIQLLLVADRIVAGRGAGFARETS